MIFHMAYCCTGHELRSTFESSAISVQSRRMSLISMFRMQPLKLSVCDCSDLRDESVEAEGVSGGEIETAT